MSETTTLVQTNNLTKRFGDFLALDGVSLEIPEGEVLGLIGPNGAGKSTFVRTLMGFMQPTSGHATIGGLDCLANRVEVHRLVSYLPGDARMYGLMRAKYALRQQLSFRHRSSRQEELDGYERGLKIAERLDLDLSHWVGLMSTGMRQKLALAVTFAADVPMLILDEPTANLDPTVQAEVLAMVKEAKAAGKTVIFSSHVLTEIESICDRVAVMRAGRLVHVQPMAEFKRRHRIQGRLADGTNNEVPAVPAALKDQLTIVLDGDQLQVEVAGELSNVLNWLATVPLKEVSIKPVGLQSVYERFHFAGNSMNSAGQESAGQKSAKQNSIATGTSESEVTE